MQCSHFCCYFGQEPPETDLAPITREEPKEEEIEEPRLPKELLEALEPEPECSEVDSEVKDEVKVTKFSRSASQDEADALSSLLRDLKKLPRCGTTCLRTSTDSLSLQAGPGPSLQCLHDVLQLLWPKVNLAVERFMTKELVGMIRDTLPTALRSFRFPHFKLGDGVPEILQAEVNENDGVELRIRFNLESQVAIALSFLGLGAALNYLSMKGSVVIRLGPLINEIPVIGGIVICFPEAPEIDFRMSCGPLEVSRWTTGKRLLRQLLDSVITSTLLLPNVIHIPLLDDEDVVDTAKLRDAKPLGVLRVVVTNVSPCGARLCSSWPQVRMQLCAEEWSCPATPPTSCFAARKPRSRVFVQLQGITGLDVEGTFLRVQLGNQAYRTETQSAQVSWTGSSPMCFDVEGSETLRIEVHRAEKILWHQSLGHVELHAGSLLSLPPSTWCARSERLSRAEQVSLQFEVRCESAERRNIHDFFVYDFKQRLKVSLMDLNYLGIPKAVAVAKPRTVSELMAGTSGAWTMHLYAPNRGEGLHDATGEIGLSLEWLEMLRDPGECFSCVLECHFDEVYATSSCEANVLAMRASLGTVVRQTPLTQRQDKEFRVETILRLPVTRSVLETESLELAAVDGRGKVIATCHLRPRQLTSQKLLRSTLHLEGAHCKLTAEVSVTCFGLSSQASATTHRRKSLEVDSLSCLQRDWVNQLWCKLHPNIITIAARQLEDPYGLFTQSLRVKVPLPLQDIHFSHFVLGKEPPVVGPFEVMERTHVSGFAGIEVKVGFKLDTEANIEMQVRGVKLGINRIQLKGELLVRLEPLLEELPVVGGIVVSFLNQPELAFEYSGLARHVDSAILQNLIETAVASMLVFPRVVTIPVGTEEQNVDRALLDPAPLGVLRISVLRAVGLPSSGWLGSRSRSPYVSLSLSPENWESSVVLHSTNPEWNERHEFLVYDKRQDLGFEVVDSNHLFLRNVIAQAEPMLVKDLVFAEEQEIALVKRDNFEDSASSISPAGSAFLRFDWLNFVRAGRRGPDPKHLLRVKFDEVDVPRKHLARATLLDPALLRMRCKVGEVVKETPAVAWFPRREEGDMEQLDLEHSLFLLITAIDLEMGVLELELLLDGQHQGLGSAQIQLADALATGMKMQNEGRLVMKHPAGEAPCRADVEISIQGLRLAQDCVTPAT